MIVYRALIWAEEVRPLKAGERAKIKGHRHDPEHRFVTMATFSGEDIRCLAASAPDKLSTRALVAATELDLGRFKATPINTVDVPRE